MKVVRLVSNKTNRFIIHAWHSSFKKKTGKIHAYSWNSKKKTAIFAMKIQNNRHLVVKTEEIPRPQQKRAVSRRVRGNKSRAPVKNLKAGQGKA